MPEPADQSNSPRQMTPEPDCVQKRDSAIHVTSWKLEHNAIARARSEKRTSAPILPGYKRTTGQPRRGDGFVKSPRRPQSQSEAVIAPPSTLAFLDKPQPPRRAISAREAGPRSSQESRNRNISPTNPLTHNRSRSGVAETGYFVDHTERSRTSKQKPKGLVWNLVPPGTQQKYESTPNALEDRRETSFSEKLRVKETLKQKKVWTLDTNIVDFGQKPLPKTPSSLVSSPVELYGRASPAPRSTPGQQRQSSQLLQPPSANTSKHLMGPSKPDRWEKERPDRTKRRATRIPSLYVPGPIPAINMAKGTCESTLATLEPLLGAIEGVSSSRRPSDDEILDETVAYFESFGFISAAAEDELDRFWETETETDTETETGTETGAETEQEDDEEIDKVAELDDLFRKVQETDDIEDEARPKLEFSAKAMKTLGLELDLDEAAANPDVGRSSSVRSPSIRPGMAPSIRSATAPSIVSDASNSRMKLRRFLGLQASGS